MVRIKEKIEGKENRTHRKDFFFFFSFLLLVGMKEHENL